MREVRQASPTKAFKRSTGKFVWFLSSVYIFALLLAVVSAKSVDPKCMRKKIVLDANAGGWGNKLSAIMSSLALGIQLGRPVEVIWESSHHLYGNISDFFVLPSKYAGNAADLLIAFNETDHHLHRKELMWTHFSCKIDLRARKDNDAYWLFRSPSLLKRLDEQCEILHLRANIDVTPLLSNPAGHGDLGNRFRSKFPRFSHQMFSDGVLKLQPWLVKAKDDFKEKHGLERYASLHIRGLFDGNGVASNLGIACIKSMLEKGIVKKAFFATEQRLVAAKVRSALPEDSLVMLDNKTMVLTIREMWEAGVRWKKPPADPSYMIRNESDVAVVEWQLLKDADYCLITSLSSTFAVTAHLVADCVIVNSTLGAECTRDLPAGHKGKPPIPTVDPVLSAQTTWYDRYFSVNATCDAKCEDHVWDKTIYRKEVKAHKTPAAEAMRTYCETSEIDSNLELKKIFS